MSDERGARPVGARALLAAVVAALFVPCLMAQHDPAAAEQSLEAGRAALARKEGSRALAQFQRALDLAPDAATRAKARRGVGLVYIGAKRFQAAYDALFEAQCNAVESEDTALRCAILDSLALAAHGLGHDEEAIDIAELLTAESFDWDVINAASASTVLFLVGTGRDDAAARARAHWLTQHCSAGDREQRLSILNATARFARDAGDEAVAIEFLLLASTLADGDAECLPIWGELAQLMFRCGKFADSRRYVDAVIDRADAIGNVAAARGAQRVLADVFAATGRLAEALELRRAILDDTPPQSVARASALSDFATVLEALGDIDEARERYVEAVDLCETLKLGEPSATARINLGRVLRESGNPREAIVHHRRALELAVQARTRNAAACGLAEDLLEVGDFDAARSYAREALDGMRAADEHDLERYALDASMHIELRANDAVAAAARLAEVEAALEQPAVLELHPDDAAGVRSRFHGCGEVAQDLATLRMNKPGASRDRELDAAYRAAAKWKGRALLEAMTGQRPRMTGPLADEWRASIVRALPDGGAFIEYVAGCTNLFAFVIAHDVFERVDLGPRRPIEMGVRKYVERLKCPNSSVAELLAEGHTLEQALLAPLASVTASRQVGLVIVPTLELAPLPFESLVCTPRNDFTDSTFVVDETPIAYAPSGAVFIELSNRPNVSAEPLALFIVVGEHETRRELPEVYSELESAGTRILDALAAPDDADKRLRKLSHTSADATLGPLRVLMGSAATRDALVGIRANYRFIHFATHGEASVRDVRQSGVFLAPGQRDDGRLGLADIETIGPRADLVFLACCETGEGVPMQGEGVLSIGHAFLAAGNRSVVVTSWSVRDSNLPRLSGKFYEKNLEAKEPFPVALHMARKELRRESCRGRSVVEKGARSTDGHPYDWAPYMYIGAWGR